MNLLGTATAVESPDFQRRVRVAAFLTALDIINNPAEVGGKRVAAAEVVAHPDQNQHLTRMVWYVAANPTVAASVTPAGLVKATDDDIMFVVSGAWAMIFPPDPTDPTDLVPPRAPKDFNGPAPLSTKKTPALD